MKFYNYGNVKMNSSYFFKLYYRNIFKNLKRINVDDEYFKKGFINELKESIK